MNIFVIVILAAAFALSNASDDIVKKQSVFYGRYGELTNSKGKILFTAEVSWSKNGEKWFLRRYCDESDEIIGIVNESPDTNHDTFITNYGKYRYINISKHQNGWFFPRPQYTINNVFDLNSTIVGTPNFFRNDYVFTQDGNTIATFTRKWLAFGHKYEITLEKGADRLEWFAYFVAFYAIEMRTNEVSS